MNGNLDEVQALGRFLHIVVAAPILTCLNRVSPLVLKSSTICSCHWSFVIEEQQATQG